MKKGEIKGLEGGARCGLFCWKEIFMGRVAAMDLYLIHVQWIGWLFRVENRRGCLYSSVNIGTICWSHGLKVYAGA